MQLVQYRRPRLQETGRVPTTLGSAWNRNGPPKLRELWRGTRVKLQPMPGIYTMERNAKANKTRKTSAGSTTTIGKSYPICSTTPTMGPSEYGSSTSVSCDSCPNATCYINENRKNVGLSSRNSRLDSGSRRGSSRTKLERNPPTGCSRGCHR